MTENEHRIALCMPRYLPRELWVEAARTAIRVNPKNEPAGTHLVDTTSVEQERLSADVSRYWQTKGVRLTVGFLDNPQVELRAKILAHLNAWNKTADIAFVETSTDPQIRIARATGMGGHWSHIGTDNLGIPKNDPTMNLEGFTVKTPDEEFFRVVRHEAGHALGFPHEHMRQELVERLDRDKVIKFYMTTQGWTEQKVIDQVLTPLEESTLLGTLSPDPQSIMCYQIHEFLTKDGQPIIGGLDISELDYEFIGQIYPKSSNA